MGAVRGFMGAAWPALALLAALGLFFLLGLDRVVSLEALRERHAELAAWTAAHPLLAGFAFAAFCVILMAIAFPSVGVLFIAGGFLFGLWGALLSAFFASVGGTIFFLAARSAAGAALRDRFAGVIARLRDGFQRNAFTYLLSLRLMPVIPFLAASTAGAAAGMGAAPFFLATFVGSLPAAFVWGAIGAGAGEIFRKGGALSIGEIVTRPEMLLALAVMAGLSIAALAFNRRKG